MERKNNEELTIKFNQLKERLRTKFYTKHINNKNEDFKLLKNEHKNKDIDLYNDFMLFLRQDNIGTLTNYKLNILRDNIPIEEVKFIQLVSDADIYSKQVINNKPITKQERLLTILQNRANKLLTTEQKRNILKAGRNAANISINVANKYTNLNDMLKAEKIMVNINHFTDEQINNIFIDPINLLFGLVLTDEIGKNNYMTQTLKLYDPDAYYNGLTFFELIEHVGELLENEDKNRNDFLATYTKFSMNTYIEAENSLRENKDARSGYGIVKVLYQYNFLDVNNIKFMFMDLRDHATDKYVIKLFIFMLEYDLKRFNIDPRSVKIGKGYKEINGKVFPFSIWNVNKGHGIINPRYNVEKFTVKIERLHKKIDDINKIIKHITVNILDDDLILQYLNRNILNHLKNSEYKNNETNDIIIDHLVDNIVNIEDDIRVLTIQKYKYMYKYNGSNILALFMYIEDYKSVNALLDAGISINTYSIMYEDEEDEEFNLYHTILYIRSLPVIKYYYTKGLDLTGNVYNRSIIHNLTREQQIPYLFWIIYRLIGIKQKKYFNVRDKQMQKIIWIIYNGFYGYTLQSTGLIDDIINIILSY